MKTTGRNELCPCGSGKKYKHCCLGQAEPAMTETGRLAHVRNATERAVFEHVMTWADRKLGRAWLEESLEALAELDPVEQDELQFLVPWFVYFFPCERQRPGLSPGLAVESPAARFLAEASERLTSSERETLVAHVRSHVSMWEVRHVEPGVSVELFDLLTHERRVVHEVRATRLLARWNVLLAAVVDYPEVSVFAGLYPRALMPGQAERVLATVRGVLGVRKRVLKPVNLRGQDVQFAMVDGWREAVRERERAVLEPRMLQNTDGDPILFCTDHFDIMCTVHELADALEAIEGAEVERGDELEEVVFTRSGISKHSRFGNAVVGRATVSGKQLLVETNSEVRAKALRRQIEHAAGSRLKYRLGKRRDANDLLENPPLAARTPAPQRSAEDQAELREIMDRMRDAWVDERVPALSHRTPRQAATSPTLRPRLVALLKEFELHEAARPEEERYDVGRLWRALGIDPLATV